MKKTKIFDFFPLSSVSNNVPCPACGTLLLKSKLNEHLDSACPSAVLSSISVGSSNKRTKVKDGETSKSPKSGRRAADKMVSNRLSRKRETNVKDIKKYVKSLAEKEGSDDDIIILEEKLVSPIKINNVKPHNFIKQGADDSTVIKNELNGSVTNKINCNISNSFIEITCEKNKAICSKFNESTCSELKVIEKQLPEICGENDFHDDVPAKRQKYSNKKPTTVSKSSKKVAVEPKAYRPTGPKLIEKQDSMLCKKSGFDDESNAIQQKLSNEKSTSDTMTKRCSKENVSACSEAAKTTKSELQVAEIYEASNKLNCDISNLSSKIDCKKNLTVSSKISETECYEVKLIENLVSETCEQSDFNDHLPAKRKKSYNRKSTSDAVTRRFSKKSITVSTDTSVTINCDMKVDEKDIPVTDLPIEKTESSDRNTTSESKSINGLDVVNDAKIVLEDDGVFSEELSDINETEETKSSQKNYVPYYIANFKHILNTVLKEEDNKVLFNDEDMKSVKDFEAATDAAQKLYVRLFQRKYKWLRINKINYPDITQDPLITLEELVKIGLVDSGSSEIDLETAIGLLSLPEAKSLAKHFNFNSGKSKADIKEMLLKHCKQHKSVFFMNGSNGISSMMLKKVKQVMGPCYRISLLPKRVFTRVLMLFSLPTMSDDEEEAAGGQQQQLITLLQVNKGELVFPDYKLNKQTVIFCDRDELIRYEEARQLENDIFNAIENKKFELAKNLYINAREEYEDQCSSKFAKRASSLPPFLKRYTSFHVYIRCMTLGVEALQRLREYKEAVSLLRKLIKQTVFCQDYKGRWYDRLALNLEQHLKQPEQALKAIKSAMSDCNVRKGHRYSLLIRALRLTKSFEDTDEFRQQILKESSVTEAPKLVIKGRLCPRTILGRRNVFISSSSTADVDEVTILGVEQLAIEHYKENGFPEGIHGEGSTFHSIYGLLFWDIIYDGSIPDVFISPYQTHPLDLNSETFFQSRKDQILNHLKTLQKSSDEELKEIVKSTWESHHGQASLVHWDFFTDLEHVQGLICSFGCDVLCGICERLAKDFRFTRSGVPDLVVWNPETLKAKIVEVKGPGDKLSSKQILWLDYLIQLGADAEVCLVEAVASKKLRKETSEEI